MKLIFSPLFLTSSLLFLLTTHLTSAYILATNALIDLERNDVCFDQEAVEWIGSSQILTTSISTTCSDTYLLGGYGVLGGTLNSNTFFSRTYNNLPSHSSIRFSFTFWALGPWTAGTDTFQLQFDSTTIDGFDTLDHSQFPSHLCGNTLYNDLGQIKVFGRVSHSLGFLTFKMIKTYNEPWTTKSFGLRDVNLLLADETITSNSMCGRASVPLGSHSCTCAQEDQYWDGTCRNCDSSCASCYGSGKNKCYACKTGYYFDGQNCKFCGSNCAHCDGPNGGSCKVCNNGYILFDGTCMSENICASPLVKTSCNTICGSPCNSVEFLYYNETCGLTCETPLRPSTTLGTIKTCQYPCSSLEILHWNGSCLGAEDCPLPLKTTVTTDNKAFCEFPCKTTEYLYWNGTCSATCKSPLTEASMDSRLFCKYPCAQNQFLAWNGTCFDSCDYPLVVRDQNGYKFCDYPCGDNEFLYWDRVCSSTCVFPYTQRLFGNKRFCDYPCNPEQFLYFDGSCQKDCLAPLSKREERGKKYCDMVCPSTQYLVLGGSCVTSCNAPFRVVTNSSGMFCVLPCDNPQDFYHEDTNECKPECYSVSVLQDNLYMKCLPYSIMTQYTEYVELSKLFHYLSYLDINMPPRLKNIRVSKGMNILSLRLGPDMFRDLRMKLGSLQLPSVFLRQELTSSFLANFIDDLILLGLVLVIATLASLLQHVCVQMKWTRLQTVFEVLRVLTRWNIPIMLFITNMGNIVFFTILELKAYETKYTGYLFSSSICLAILLGVVSILIGTFFLVREAQAAKNESLKSISTHDNYDKYLARWQCFHVLFLGCSDSNFFNQFFLIIYCIRQVLPMVIASLLYVVPFLQVSLYILITLLIIVYIIVMKPVKRKLDHINLLILEGIILFVNICFLALAICDKTNSSNLSARTFFGDAIIIGNFSVNVLAIVFLNLKFLQTIQHAIKLGEQKSKQTRGAWLQLAFLPFQQGAMGFEQVNIDNSYIDDNSKTNEKKALTLESSSRMAVWPGEFQVAKERAVTDVEGFNISRISFAKRKDKNMHAHVSKIEMRDDVTDLPSVDMTSNNTRVKVNDASPNDSDYFDAFPIKRITHNVKTEGQ